MIWNGYKTKEFSSWDNNSRIEIPTNDIFGYNIEENRFEYFIKSLNQWFYLSGEFIKIKEDPDPPTIFENFESGWLIESNFNKIFEELFENNWFISNTFSSLFLENFENGGW